MKQNIFIRIWHGFINLLKLIVIFIMNLFLKKDEKINYKETKTINNDIKEKSNNTPITPTSLPDESNNKISPHDDTSDDTNNNLLFEMPKEKLQKLKETQINKEIIFTKELIIHYIEEELEEIYKEQKLDIKKAEKELLKKIQDFEEKVVPKIITQIEFYHLKKEDEVKKEVKKIVEIELIETPIFPPILKENEKKKSKSQNEVYFIAYPKKKELNLNIQQKKATKIEEQPIVTTPSQVKESIKTKIADKPLVMVQNLPEIPKPSLTSELKNIAIASTLVTANAIGEILTTSNKDLDDNRDILDRKTSTKDAPQEQENEKISEQVAPTITNTTNTPSEDSNPKDNNKKDISPNIKEEKKTQEIIENIQILQNEIEKKVKELQEEQQNKKEHIENIQEKLNDTEITDFSNLTDSLILDSKEELSKEDFIDKDYDRLERQINKMLEDISNTYIRYEKSMSPHQKKKLQDEEKKLRSAKDNIQSQKEQDLSFERKQLQDSIEEIELTGLQNELKKIDEENKKEVNDEFFLRLNSFEGMTKEQLANADKKILMRRLSKASLLMEMGSILALPFIRNRYFNYFTIGLIIDNHFNFINAFWKRKINKYEPPELNNIKQGQDALNGALDITYKNLVELDYIEQQALERYPELAQDPRFVNQIMNLRIKLNNNYNKLMKKNKTMEKYFYKSKRQTKILKKELKK